ncbi:MAG: hypothetical protein Q9187_001664 [Circinaria calcarea]
MDPSKSGSQKSEPSKKDSDKKEKDEYRLRFADVGPDAKQYDVPTELMRRPKTGNATGQQTIVNINSYLVKNFPTTKVIQYDVNIGNGNEKRGLIRMVWESPQLQKKLRNPNGSTSWIFDGNKIAWSAVDKPGEMKMMIDLDKDKNIPPREGRSNTHKISIRRTGYVNLVALQAYLNGTMAFDNSVLEAISFLDHLLREDPSKRMIAIKRSFFHSKITARASIGGGVEAMKGVYQSIRAAQGGKLIVNVDVSNSTFWGPWKLTVLAAAACGSNGIGDLSRATQKTEKTQGAAKTDHIFMMKLRKLNKAKFHVICRNYPENLKKKIWTIKCFSYLSSHTWKFDLNDRSTGTVRPNVSLNEYFKLKYDIHLEFPHLPVVETMKKGVAFPMEVCVVEEGQRYPFKLDEEQTKSMIKFAVTRPSQRKADIQGGLNLLNWSEDPFLKGYNMNIESSMLATQARLLAPPAVEFGGKFQLKPMYSGRWRIDQKKFFRPNSQPLISWGVCVVNGNGRDIVDPTEARAFIADFVRIYKEHGGVVSNPTPLITQGGSDIGATILNFFSQIGNAYNKRPQMMVFMLSSKDAFQYTRIKKSCDCRWGVVSQCMQNAHIKKRQPQYISNVLMKFNAKLGGATSRVPGKSPYGHFKVPTIIVGADVSHASPGSMQPSMAALTVSMDALCLRYAAACETNGHRVEMITTSNMEQMLMPLFRNWMETVGQGRKPAHVIYFRDGVSEGQYQHVMQQEVRDLKRVWTALFGNDNRVLKDIKFTVIVASKRHHIRFFPQKGDNNGNPQPGTLVEKDVTHPFEYDFYLNSHSAIQGTARPTHYHVLMDEMDMSASDLQNMIYEQCYQYMRSTTPVSLHPAVYYAHLASNRAKSHEDISASQGPHKATEDRKALEHAEAIRAAEAIGGLMMSSSSAEKPPTETKPLLPMENSNGICWGMWYI